MRRLRCSSKICSLFLLISSCSGVLSSFLVKLSNGFFSTSDCFSAEAVVTEVLGLVPVSAGDEKEGGEAAELAADEDEFTAVEDVLTTVEDELTAVEEELAEAKELVVIVGLTDNVVEATIPVEEAEETLAEVEVAAAASAAGG